MMKNIFLWTLCMFVLSGCSPRYDLRGKPLEARDVASLKVGKTTYKQVQDILGSPSAMMGGQNQFWVYETFKTKQVSFFQPEKTHHEATLLTFDGRGLLKEIRSIQKVDVGSFDPLETPLYDHEHSWAQKIFGNFGKRLKNQKTPQKERP